MINPQNIRYSAVDSHTCIYAEDKKISISFVTIVMDAGKIQAAAWKIPSSSIKNFKAPNNSTLMYLVDTRAGITSAANNIFTKRIESHIGLEGLNVPCWREIQSIAKQCYHSMPMAHLTIEVSVSLNHDVRLINVDITPQKICGYSIH